MDLLMGKYSFEREVVALQAQADKLISDNVEIEFTDNATGRACAKRIDGAISMVAASLAASAAELAKKEIKQHEERLDGMRAEVVELKAKARDLHKEIYVLEDKEACLYKEKLGPVMPVMQALADVLVGVGLVRGEDKETLLKVFAHEDPHGTC